MTTAAQIIAQKPAVLLDFDGPVCSVFGTLPDYRVADELKARIGGRLPREVAASRDPFTVLSYSVGLGPIAADLELRLRELELEAVASAPGTPGAGDFLTYLSEAGVFTVIVSNNSHAAVGAYLRQTGLDQHVLGISARSDADPNWMKPNPVLLHEAMATLQRPADECVMIGDSLSDIQAAKTAGTMSISYANKPGKHDRMLALNPDAVVDRIEDLIPRS